MKTLFLLSLAAIPAFAFMEGGEECSPKFPSTVRIYTSIKNEAGEEVWNSMCTGNVIDPKIVLTDEHCFFKKPMSLVSGVPAPIREKYEKLGQKLRTEYIVDGIKASLAISVTSSLQGVLQFAEELPTPATKIKFDEPMPEGRVCQIVGLSPMPEIQKEKVNISGAQGYGEKPKTLEELQKILKLRRQFFTTSSKRCGQSRSSGRAFANTDATVFAGIQEGDISTQGGDSGGACYVKDGNEWKLAGIVEGQTKLRMDGGPDLTGKTNNNAIVIFSGEPGQKLRKLLALAQKVRGQKESPALPRQNNGHIDFRSYDH